jgi:hypothetical protein
VADKLDEFSKDFAERWGGVGAVEGVGVVEGVEGVGVEEREAAREAGVGISQPQPLSQEVCHISYIIYLIYTYHISYLYISYILFIHIIHLIYTYHTSYLYISYILYIHIIYLIYILFIRLIGVFSGRAGGLTERRSGSSRGTYTHTHIQYMLLSFNPLLLSFNHLLLLYYCLLIPTPLRQRACIRVWLGLVGVGGMVQVWV